MHDNAWMTRQHLSLVPLVKRFTECCDCLNSTRSNLWGPSWESQPRSKARTPQCQHCPTGMWRERLLSSRIKTKMCRLYFTHWRWCSVLILPCGTQKLRHLWIEGSCWITTFITMQPPTLKKHDMLTQRQACSACSAAVVRRSNSTRRSVDRIRAPAVVNLVMMYIQNMLLHELIKIDLTVSFLHFCCGNLNAISTANRWLVELKSCSRKLPSCTFMDDTRWYKDDKQEFGRS